MAVKHFAFLILLLLCKYSSVQCQEDSQAAERITPVTLQEPTEATPMSPKLTKEIAELKEGVSALKQGLVDLKNTMATLTRKQAKLTTAVLMAKNNMTDSIEDALENAKMELKECIRNESTAHEDKVLEKISGLQQTCTTSSESGSHYRDCKDAYEQGQTQNGVYSIKPDSGSPFDVYCNMGIDGGGWTVIQRRQDGSQNFYLYWNDYVRGFGDLNGEFWLGLENIHRLTTSTPRTELRIDLQDFSGGARYAKYNRFAVGDIASRYILTARDYRGDAGDSLAEHNGNQFSTRDYDNDQFDGECAVLYSGAWWYNRCHKSNLNGLYLRGSHTTYANGIQWKTWRGYYYSLRFTEMKLRRA